jgi:hypothetical protein
MLYTLFPNFAVISMSYLLKIKDILIVLGLFSTLKTAKSNLNDI